MIGEKIRKPEADRTARTGREQHVTGGRAEEAGKGKRTAPGRTEETGMRWRTAQDRTEEAGMGRRTAPGGAKEPAGVSPDRTVADERRRTRFQNKSAFIASKYLRRAEQLSGIPESMTPFLETLRRIFIDFAEVERSDGRKAVGTYCVMVPQELIYAAGAIDIKLCSGSLAAFAVGDDVSPRDACPLVKAVAGYQEIGGIGLYDSCSLMVVPITCDCKKKMAGVLARHMPVHTMRVPSAPREDRFIEEYTRELYRLIPVLEETTGSRITRETLLDSAGQIGFAQYAFSVFLRLKKEPGRFCAELMRCLPSMPAAICRWMRGRKR